MSASMTAGTPPAQADFFVCDILDAIPKDDMASMEHPIFSLSTRPDRRVLRYTHKDADIEITPSVKGLATIHDKDILIYCISQLVAALNEGRKVSQEVTLKSYDLLVATGRETSGNGYKRLVQAFERLAGRRVYEIARKHCGQQRAWKISLENLLNKSGSASPRRVFRKMIRDMVAENHLPDYEIRLDENDIFHVTPRRLLSDDIPAPALPDGIYDEVRAVAPGYDPYFLEAEWRAFWMESGCPKLRAPARAFLAFCRKRHEKEPLR